MIGLRFGKLICCKISLRQQIAGSDKIRIQLERPLKLRLGCIPFSFSDQDFAFQIMCSSDVGVFLELTSYPLSRSVKTLVQQIQLDELVDSEQIIRHELDSFFECLARFVISFGLAQRHSERYLRLWIVRRKLGLVVKDRGDIVEPTK